MTNAFSKLGLSELRSLATDIDADRVGVPCSELQVQRSVSHAQASSVAEAINELAGIGFSSAQLVAFLHALADDRESQSQSNIPIDLVTSGPEAPGITNRDTSVIVRELFAHAKKTVLVVGYSVYQGQEVFESLGNRMQQLPELDVQFFLNIARRDRDTTKSSILLSRYKNRFINSQWPSGCRLPEVFYDPRSLEMGKRSSLHAKCIVVDGEQVFVSSANFTKAGQERNIEVGLSIKNEWLAKKLTQHFQKLREQDLAKRAF